MKSFSKLVAALGLIAVLGAASYLPVHADASKSVAVKASTRKTKSGKIVPVKAYTRKSKAPGTKTVHVKAYTRKTKSGKTVHVKASTRHITAKPKM